MQKKKNKKKKVAPACITMHGTRGVAAAAMHLEAEIICAGLSIERVRSSNPMTPVGVLPLTSNSNASVGPHSPRRARRRVRKPYHIAADGFCTTFEKPRPASHAAGKKHDRIFHDSDPQRPMRVKGEMSRRKRGRLAESG